MYRSRGQRKTLEAFRIRLYFLSVAIAISFLLIFVQLIKLQLVQGEEYRLRSRNNMETFIPIQAPRGEIYARDFGAGKKNHPLVSNRVSFNVITIPAKFKNQGEMKTILSRLSRIADIPLDFMLAKIKKSNNPFIRVSLKEDIPYRKIVKIASFKDQLDYITWETIPKRNYLYGNLYAHLLGYTGKISKRELRKNRSKGYKYYNIIGKNGIEKEYDILLRGKDGRIKRIVDVKRRTEGESLDTLPLPGRILVLTIDHEIQKIVYESMKKMVGVGGCVIVMRPATGEILAMVSKPDYDPNFMVSIDDPEKFKVLAEDERKPFLNRAIQIKNPPSSTFKPLVGLAALEEGKLTYHDKYRCEKRYILKGLRDRTFYCWGYHGSNRLVFGIAKSCNIFFYQVGLSLGSVPILNYARYFGLGEKTQVDLPGEISGFVPSDKWKRKTFRQRWFDGDTLNISIGQGFLQFTPIGMAQYYSGLVNNGIINKPHILKEVRNPQTKEVELKVRPQILREVPVKKENLDKILEGIREVVRSGTTRYMNHPKIKIAGKTGTVQTFSITREKEYLRKRTETHHAWFIGFAPFDADIKDKILVAVFVEYGRSGSGGAAPIAYRIFKEIYVKNRVPWLSEKNLVSLRRKN